MPRCCAGNGGKHFMQSGRGPPVCRKQLPICTLWHRKETL